MLKKDDIIYKNIILKINDLNTYISNGYLQIYINKKAYVEKLFLDNINILENIKYIKTFYLDANGGKFTFIPNNITIIQYNSNIAHIMYNMNINNEVCIEYHFILLKYLSGIYSYVRIENLNSNLNSIYAFGEIRTVYKFDYSIMDMLYNGDIIQKSYLYEDLNTLPSMQDETWQLRDGSYYSKYDLANYVRNIKFYGVYGKTYGAWLMNFSNEYYSGGPLKQDLIVHQDSLMLNYLHSTHFGTNPLKIPQNYKWNKTYGPWLIYFNNKNYCKTNLITDANIFYNKNKNKWPFDFIKDKNYINKNRKSIKGYLKNINNNKYKIILYSSINEQFDFQTLGYLYTTTNNKEGLFIINNIIPNIYNLYIYPITGNDSEHFSLNNIDLTQNNIILDDIKINNLKYHYLWNIGQTNRKSTGFKYSDKNRNYIWHTLVPKNYDFYIKKENNNEKNWYYAQTKKGTWNIYFYDTEFDKNKNNRILNINFSSVSINIDDNNIPKLEIYINNILIKTCIYSNDKSIYRGALQSGNYHKNKIIINYKLILPKLNIISLKLINGSFMYDNINYALEMIGK